MQGLIEQHVWAICAGVAKGHAKVSDIKPIAEVGSGRGTSLGMH